jgi:hypothetical protein
VFSAALIPTEMVLGCHPSLRRDFSDSQFIKIFRFFRTAASNSTNNSNLYWKYHFASIVVKTFHSISEEISLLHSSSYDNLYQRCFIITSSVVLSFNFL